MCTQRIVYYNLGLTVLKKLPIRDIWHVDPRKGGGVEIDLSSIKIPGVL